MSKNWGTFWNKSKKPLKTCWLITAGFVSLYVGLIQPRGYQREIAQTRATGLGAVAGGPSWQPISLWRQMSVDKAVIGGALGEAAGSKAAVMTYLEGDVGRGDEDKTVDRELVRTASLSLVVKAPSEASERIIQLAQAADGFLVSSQLGGAADVPSATLTIRVPASKFDEVRAQIRKLSLHVESESIEAQDVTKQYVDQEARLRNLRAIAQFAR